MLKEPKHSLLLTLSDEEVFQYQEKLLGYLKEGIKVLLFTISGKLEISSDFHPFIKKRLFQQYQFNNIQYNRLIIVDGELNEEDDQKLKQLGIECQTFNEEQYRVEHADPLIHLCVEAGAGTGKTTVMIERILFLIHTTQVSLHEIVMITFTREAAKNMSHKLREALYQRYKLTGSVRYLERIEELRLMRISTIHSFARNLIKGMGSELGYGQNVQIRSLKLERKKIIEKYINEKVAHWPENVEIREKFKGIKLYKIINIIDDYWTEIERKGITKSEIEQLRWGDASGESADLHELFTYVISKCEKEYDELKRTINAITLSDLTRQVEFVSRRKEGFKGMDNTYKYVFIDEFQDTDDSQIKLANRLVEALKSRLFVVGDIKQSIYRFRGADYTAFESLRKMLEIQEEQYITLHLRKNYRSTALILDKMDEYFSKWGKKNLLQYDQPLIGVVDDANSNIIIKDRNFERYSKDHQKFTIDTIKDAKKMMQNLEGNNMAILVRTNSQALRIKAWCDEANINNQLDIGGLFFTSVAVKEFTYLIDALLYQNSVAEQVNLFNSSYSKVRIHWSSLMKFEGDEEKIIEWINEFEPIDSWKEITKKLLTKPLMSTLREILDTSNPSLSYYNEQLQLLESERPEDPENLMEATSRARQYQKNINHLFELIHQKFSTDFLTLYGLSTWLHTNIAINRDEDEPELTSEELGNRIRIMTVHKSKGLEFHTVLLPFTEQNFRYDRSELLLEHEDGIWNVGWQVKEKDNMYSNKFYESITTKETEEVKKEEARLLYVAMTRTERNLWIIKNNKYHYVDNWRQLLSM